MDPTGANLQIFFTGLQVAWQGAYEQEATFADQIATMLPSSTELEQYGWMDKVSQLTQWLGPRTVNALPTRTRVITNLDWQRTDSIPRNKFVDDKLGLFTFQAKDMGAATAKLDDLQLVKIIQGTATTQTGPAVTGNPTAFDGVSFWNTAHPVDIDAGTGGPYGSYANDFPTTIPTTAGTVSSALGPAAYEAARASMRGYLGRDGIPLGIRPALLLVPPQLEGAAKNLLEAGSAAPTVFSNNQTQVGANDNVWKGTAKYIVIDEMANQPRTWYMIDPTRSIRPFVAQKREGPYFVYLVNPNDVNVFYQKEYVFGVHVRSAYDVTIPFLAARFGSGL
jgi:phage major head subunit gpT-like protein